MRIKIYIIVQQVKKLIIEIQTKITEVQKMMNQYKVHSVLVVDDDNHLLGVVDHYSCMI